MIIRNELSNGEVLVSPTNEATPFSFTVETHRQIITADEPRESGGNDHGMNPFDLLAASLATCTAMTLRYYANHKGFDLGFFQVKVHISKQVIEDSSTPVIVFARDIRFGESKSPDQITKIKEIAEKCPVHKALTGEIKIETDVN